VSVGERAESLLPVAESAPPVALVSARLEAKYRIGRDVASALREQLAVYLTPHHHSVPPGMIASGTLHHVTTTVYFDTERRDLCRAATRLPAHLKVRARSYRDEPAPSSADEPPIWIELKERDGMRSRKRRAPLDRCEAGRWFAALSLEDGALSKRVCDATVIASADPARIALLSDLAQLRLALGAPLSPSCVVRYRREAFQDPCGTLRITLDQDVQAFEAPRSPFDAGALEPTALGAPTHREPGCVLEIKTVGELPGWLAAILAAQGTHATEYSKLVMASIAVHGPL
jgi:hypothetical protein